MTALFTASAIHEATGLWWRDCGHWREVSIGDFFMLLVWINDEYWLKVYRGSIPYYYEPLRLHLAPSGAWGDFLRSL